MTRTHVGGKCQKCRAKQRTILALRNQVRDLMDEVDETHKELDFCLNELLKIEAKKTELLNYLMEGDKDED